jgi:hypothetical protein
MALLSYFNKEISSFKDELGSDSYTHRSSRICCKQAERIQWHCSATLRQSKGGQQKRWRGMIEGTEGQIYTAVFMLLCLQIQPYQHAL